MSDYFIYTIILSAERFALNLVRPSGVVFVSLAFKSSHEKVVDAYI
jgi:hypothetical protein